MNCPRCLTHLEDQVVAVTDTPTGLVVTVDHATASHQARCPCTHLTYTVTSTRSNIHQPELTLITRQETAA